MMLIKAKQYNSKKDFFFYILHLNQVEVQKAKNKIYPISSLIWNAKLVPKVAFAR